MFGAIVLKTDKTQAATEELTNFFIDDSEIVHYLNSDLYSLSQHDNSSVILSSPIANGLHTHNNEKYSCYGISSGESFVRGKDINYFEHFLATKHKRDPNPNANLKTNLYRFFFKDLRGSFNALLLNTYSKSCYMMLAAHNDNEFIRYDVHETPHITLLIFGNYVLSEGAEDFGGKVTPNSIMVLNPEQLAKKWNDRLSNAHTEEAQDAMVSRFIKFLRERVEV